jgi:hypothetical protein
VGLTGPAFNALQRGLASPLNYAVGLAAFQIFFIPTGVMYWLASRTSPRDIADVHQMLDGRAAEPSPDDSSATPNQAASGRPASSP